MKQAKIVALVLLLLIVGGGIAEQLYIKKVFLTLNGYTQALERDIDESNFAAARARLPEFEAWWKKNSSVLESLSNNRDLKALSVEISRLDAYLTEQNSNDARAAVAAIRSTGENIKNLLSFKIEHII
jgi:hypothetical protein